MRWIDVDLRRLGTAGQAGTDRAGSEHPDVAECAWPGAAARGHLEAAITRLHELPALQEREGPDSSAAVELMADVGRRLFRAATAIDPYAFASDRTHEGAVDPQVGLAETDHVAGYHLVVSPQHLTLPWTWLHNGVDFLLVNFAIVASTAGSCAEATGATTGPAWCRRLREVLRVQRSRGPRPLASWLDELRPVGGGNPEILFLAGHCEETVRPLLYREANVIRNSLAASPLQRPLARLRVPDRAVTPDQLRRRGAAFQGFHFAGPTARPPVGKIETAWEYLASLGAATDASDASGASDIAGASGASGVPGVSGASDAPEAAAAAAGSAGVGDLDYVGVDQITAILDELSERADRQERLEAQPTTPNAAGWAALRRDIEALASVGAGAAGQGPGAGPCIPFPAWLLDDGPVHPEELARVGGAPPLVFSNSYLSLPDLGARFLQAGASAFIGPTAAIMSRPAREFAARFYSCLADGYCAAAALRSAALACRERHGADNPTWLTYGLIGSGSLALQYL